jgi:hypothetical protein
MAAPLKVALVVDGENLDEHRLRLVEWANSTESVRISHLIIQQRDPGPRPPLPVRLLRKRPAQVAAQALWKLKSRLEADDTGHRDAGDHRRLELIRQAVPGRILVRPRISPSGFVYRYSEEDLAKIRGEGFDLLIRCGSGILRGGVLTCARLGILSFHHGDNRVNRGGPAGFWEVYYRWSTTGFVVQRLTEELDGGDVLLRGSVPTQDTHAKNCALLYEKSYFQLRGLLLRIAETGALPPPEPHVPYSSRLYTDPRATEIARYLVRRARRSIEGRMRKHLQLQERWGVCFVKSDWPDAAFWRGKRIETPPGRFLADPFVVTREGRTCVFVEDYAFSTSKGRITAFELGESGAQELGVAVEEEFHLSFPFLFEHDGSLFMCPEAAASGQIRLYRCLEFPLKWRLERIAMSGVSAADSMLFPHGGLWWLLTNLSEAPPVDHSAQLHVFSAPDPLAERWEPHPDNPVRNDPAYGRNAGLLRRGGEIVRVCQVQGFRSYGAGATLMRIVRLDRDAFIEEPICQLTPDFLPGAHGTHHLHSNGVYSVWDYKRWERVKCKPERAQRLRTPAAERGALPSPGASLLSMRADSRTGIGRADG